MRAKGVFYRGTMGPPPWTYRKAEAPPPPGVWRTTCGCICGNRWSVTSPAPSVAAGDFHCPQCGDGRVRRQYTLVSDA